MSDSGDRRTSDSLTEYNNQLKAGLANGLNFTKIMDIMIYTNDKQDLLGAARKLIDYQLDSDFVHFPIKYSKADLYMLFMNRLLEEHEIAPMIQMDTNGVNGELIQRIAPLEDHDSFEFQVDHNSVAYIDSKFRQPIFYIDLDKETVVFNSKSLLNLFLVKLRAQLSPTIIIGTVRVLIEFAKFMHEDYGYQIDYGILGTNNEQFTGFKMANLPSQIIDQLFISASKAGYTLMSYASSGAQLDLNGSKVNIFNNGVKTKHVNWGLQVVDDDAQVSWFQLLLKHDFLKQWYLDNLDYLELDSTKSR